MHTVSTKDRLDLLIVPIKALRLSLPRGFWGRAIDSVAQAVDPLERSVAVSGHSAAGRYKNHDRYSETALAPTILG